MLIFVHGDGAKSRLIFSESYKKKSFKLQLFTDYRLLIEWLQIGYKQDLWTFNKIMYARSFDIDKKKGYNTNHRSEKLRAAFCAAFKKENDQKPTSALAEGR
mgnify:CR=1 FL=1